MNKFIYSSYNWLYCIVILSGRQPTSRVYSGERKVAPPSAMYLRLNLYDFITDLSIGYTKYELPSLTYYSSGLDSTFVVIKQLGTDEIGNFVTLKYSSALVSYHCSEF
jgi:hypothetical protein